MTSIGVDDAMPSTQMDAESRDRLVASDIKHVVQPWAPSQRDARRIVAESAQGSRITLDGHDVLDFAAQTAYVNVGHRHPKVVEAIRRQLDVLPVAWSRYVTVPRARLAERLSELAPTSGRGKVFFTPGGAEAVEAAMMAAREVTGRPKIVTQYRAYHGATFGTIAASGDQRGWQSINDPSSIVRVPGAYPYRCQHCGDNCRGRCVAYVEEVIRLEGAKTIAAIMVEPVQGTNGVIVPPDGYLPALRDIAHRHGILLIADEVMTGFGRTGRWFACEHWNVEADIVVVAKGLTSGYIPMGAAIFSPAVAEYFDIRPWLRGHTYTGHALAAAAALAVIDVIEDENLIDRSRDLGRYLLEQLEKLGRSHVSVGEVRGKGLFAGIELVLDPKSRQPLYDFVTGDGREHKRAVLDSIFDAGVLLMEGNSSTLILAPPLTITQDEIDTAVHAVDIGLDVADRIVAAGA